MIPIYAAIMKIDEEQRLVFGYASTEKRDQQGEIVRHAALERALPDYMRFANIREMHQPSAVGTAQEAVMDGNGLWLGAHVVDDTAWLKVKKGVYKGFSIGGKVTARDPNDRTIITALDLHEISLVDRPANPEATIQLVKRAEGALWPQPVQVWACFDRTHQHTGKDEASKCMQTDFEKRAQPRSADGKLSTHTKAAADARAEAERHQEMAEGAVKAADRHRGIAERAQKDGDPTTETIHRQLEHGSTRLAEQHRQNAAQYSALAAQHEEHVDMTTKTAAHAAAEQAEALLAMIDSSTALASGVVKSEGMDHAQAADDAAKRGSDHDAFAKKHDAAASSLMASAKKARDLGDEAGANKHEAAAKAHRAIAARHHMMADRFKALKAHHEREAKSDKAVKALVLSSPLSWPVLQKVGGGPYAEGDDPPVVDHSAEAEAARHWATAHDAVRDQHTSDAKIAEGRAMEAHTSGEHEVATKAKDEADGHRAAAAHHGAIADGYREMAGHHEKEKAGYEAHTGNMSEKVLPATALVKTGDGFVNGTFDYGWFGKRDFTDKERQALADKGHALPDGSFPIETKTDLEDAVHAYGRAKDKAKAKAHIIARAKDLGATDMLPEDWEGSTKKVAKSDMKCASCDKAIEEHTDKCPHCGKATKAEKSVRRAALLKALGGDTAKGMHAVACLAHMLDEIRYMQQNSAMEQFFEGDTSSDLPAKIQAWLSQGAELLVAIVAEETEELIDDTDVEVRGGETEVLVIERAAKAARWPMSIAQALRASVTTAKGMSADQRGDRKRLADALEKFASTLAARTPNTAVVKSLTEERDVALTSLTKMIARTQPLIGDVVAMRKREGELVTSVTALTKRLEMLERQPLPSPVVGPGMTAITKSSDAGTTVDAILEHVPAGHERAEALLQLAGHRSIPAPGGRF